MNPVHALRMTSSFGPTAAPRRATPWLLLLLALGALFGLSGCDYTDLTVPGYNKGYKPIQPISFSHKIHAGDLKMECKYCHFGSEKSKKAGIPPLNVCMNCHTQVRTDSPEIKKLTEAYKSGKSIEWIKIHNLPDYVQFDHSRHVGKGVACQTCHGPIQEMAEVKQHASLAMGWCVNCHRDYTKNPPAELKDKHIYAPIDCAGCHH